MERGKDPIDPELRRTALLIVRDLLRRTREIQFSGGRIFGTLILETFPFIGGYFFEGAGHWGTRLGLQGSMCFSTWRGVGGRITRFVPYPFKREIGFFVLPWFNYLFCAGVLWWFHVG